MADANGLNPGDPGYDPSTEQTAAPTPGSTFWDPPPLPPWTPGSPITTDPTTGAPLPAGSTMGPNPGQINFAPGAGPVTNIPPGYQEGTAIPIANLNNGGDLWHQIDAALTAGGWPRQQGDVDYWLGKVNETGGTFSPYWQNRISDGPGKGSNAPGSLGSLGNSDLLTPFTEQFKGLDPFPAFKLPTGEDIASQDPGFAFRRDQGAGALKNNYAARGLAVSGGALKGLIDYNQSAASQEYGAGVSRALDAYKTNYQTQYADPEQNLWNQYLQRYNVFRTNQSDPFSKLYQTATLGQTAAS